MATLALSLGISNTVYNMATIHSTKKIIIWDKKQSQMELLLFQGRNKEARRALSTAHPLIHLCRPSRAQYQSTPSRPNSPLRAFPSASPQRPTRTAEHEERYSTAQLFSPTPRKINRIQKIIATALGTESKQRRWRRRSRLRCACSTAASAASPPSTASSASTSSAASPGCARMRPASTPTNSSPLPPHPVRPAVRPSFFFSPSPLRATA